MRTNNTLLDVKGSDSLRRYVWPDYLDLTGPAGCSTTQEPNTASDWQQKPLRGDIKRFQLHRKADYAGHSFCTTGITGLHHLRDWICAQKQQPSGWPQDADVLSFSSNSDLLRLHWTGHWSIDPKRQHHSAKCLGVYLFILGTRLDSTKLRQAPETFSLLVNPLYSTICWTFLPIVLLPTPRVYRCSFSPLKTLANVDSLTFFFHFDHRRRSLRLTYIRYSRELQQWHWGTSRRPALWDRPKRCGCHLQRTEQEAKCPYLYCYWRPKNFCAHGVGK